MRARASIALFVLAALLLGGCGGSDSETTAEGEVSAAREQRPAAEQEPQAQGQEEGPGNPKPSASPNPPIATERIPGSKAVAPGVPTTKGGDNSIQAFGAEGEEDEAAQAAAQLRAYLSARVAGDWAAACAATSAQYREQLARMVAPTPDEKEPKGCEQTLALLFAKAPKQALQEAAEVNRVLSFRVEESGYAYLIYEDAEGEIRFIAMANEDGAWKVNTIEPTGFPETEEQGSTQ